MTVTQSITRQPLLRSGLAAALLGVALLIASAQPGSAGELTPTLVSAPQATGASQSDPGTTPAPATPARAMLPPLVGAAGFGWG
jgi:hypothetical protein